MYLGVLKLALPYTSNTRCGCVCTPLTSARSSSPMAPGSTSKSPRTPQLQHIYSTPAESAVLRPFPRLFAVDSRHPAPPAATTGRLTVGIPSKWYRRSPAISGPVNEPFQHPAHMQYDEVTGFTLRGVGPSWVAAASPVPPLTDPDDNIDYRSYSPSRSSSDDASMVFCTGPYFMTNRSPYPMYASRAPSQPSHNVPDAKPERDSLQHLNPLPKPPVLWLKRKLKWKRNISPPTSLHPSPQHSPHHSPEPSPQPSLISIPRSPQPRPEPTLQDDPRHSPNASPYTYTPSIPYSTYLVLPQYNLYPQYTYPDYPQYAYPAYPPSSTLSYGAPAESPVLDVTWTCSSSDLHAEADRASLPEEARSSPPLVSSEPQEHPLQDTSASRRRRAVRRKAVPKFDPSPNEDMHPDPPHPIRRRMDAMAEKQPSQRPSAYFWYWYRVLNHIITNLTVFSSCEIL